MVLTTCGIYSTTISDRYVSSKSQEIDLKLMVFLKDTATVVLVSWFEQRHQMVNELISTYFVSIQLQQLFIRMQSSTLTSIHMSQPAPDAMLMNDNA
ncbi:hypothetical protein TNCT_152131 [Trichonephila clavata]|uniref:Uncharacterized protein n=1 Tax=Trichonephila clavata TaxID=2740835 RepID=A0A8X6H5J0_TRICU|nr:hypothetical protein TNCT_152131 [Trichonephila clavata]